MAKINFGGVVENVVTRDEFSLDKARDILKDETIAIIGYGVQGPGQALNLRDNGFNVIVGQRSPSDSYDKAIQDGFVPGVSLFSIEEAVEKADIIQYLLSDAAQIAVWPQIKPKLTKGKALYFSHGFGITYKDRTGIIPSDDIDVILVAPKGSGTSLRRLFLAGKGLNSSYAIYQDATGRAWERVIALGIGIGSGYLFETNFKSEVYSDLTGERGTLMGAIAGIFEAQYNCLRKRGHSPSEAFNETVEELTESLMPLVAENGMDWMYANCSTTAQRGALDWKNKFRDAVSPVFEELYDKVASGEEAQRSIDANSQPDYRVKLEEELRELRESEMWQTGRMVRSLAHRILKPQNKSNINSIVQATDQTTNFVSVEKILQASKRLKDIAYRTPLVKNYNLSNQYNCNVFLKREDMQVVRSFKIRGAYNKMAGIPKENLEKGVICASAGNHAQGVAFACKSMGVKAIIYMPSATPRQKIRKVRHFGKEAVEVVLVGDSFDDCNEAALKRGKEEDLTYIHPFDDLDVMAGQGTVGLEIHEDADFHIDFLLVAVGGGGLISGIGSYFKQVSPKTQIIAVEAAGAPALEHSLRLGKKTRLRRIDGFADGIAVKTVGTHTFPICQKVVDELVLIPEGKICSTILQLYNEEAIVMEPAGAITISALDHLQEKIQGKNVVCCLSGGNNDITRTEEIRERALLYEGRKHYFLIRFPQRTGALREFLSLLGPEDDITHFQYTKKNNRATGPAIVGIELKHSKDYDSLVSRMQNEHINFQHINKNPMLFEMLI